MPKYFLNAMVHFSTVVETETPELAAELFESQLWELNPDAAVDFTVNDVLFNCEDCGEAIEPGEGTHPSLCAECLATHLEDGETELQDMVGAPPLLLEETRGH